MKKQILLIVLLALTLVLNACGAPAAKPEPSPAPTLTAAPTIATTPVPAPELTPDAAALEKFDMAPDIIGLEKEIREKDGIWKVVYIYLEGNNYTGVSGEYAGEYKKEVTVTDPETGETEEVGGLALRPEVVKRLIEMGRPDDRFVAEDGTFAYAIPLDISNMGLQSVRVSYIKENNNSNITKGFSIDFEGSLPVICTAIGREDIDANYILGKNSDGSLYLIEDLIKNYNIGVDNGYKDILFPMCPQLGEPSIDWNLITRYLYFIGDFKVEVQSENVGDEVDFGKFVYGEKMCNVDSTLICKDWSKSYNLEDEVLKIGDSIVFLCESDS